MLQLIKEDVALTLKSIEYKYKSPTENKKIDINDKISVIKITNDNVELEISRKVSADLQAAYDLIVTISIKYFARPGIDLTTELTYETIEKNKMQITGVAMNYLSALITQITSSFGGYPIVTAPALRDDIKIEHT